jgi:hypothetical protein
MFSACRAYLEIEFYCRILNFFTVWIVQLKLKKFSHQESERKESSVWLMLHGDGMFALDASQRFTGFWIEILIEQ